MFEALRRLIRQLMPSGRAWRVPFGSGLDKLINGILLIYEQAYTDATSGILDTILADNENFSEEDATTWERRLGISANPLTNLEDRKAAIRRKYGEPFGKNRAKQHYLTIQNRLRAAGFDLYVHENLTGQLPTDLNPNIPILSHGDVNHGEQGHGAAQGLIKIVNHIDDFRDNNHVVGDPHQIFFIGGLNPGDYADIPLTRYLELRELVMILKPLHCVALVFGNFVDDADQWILADGTWNDDGIWLDDAVWID